MIGNTWSRQAAALSSHKTRDIRFLLVSGASGGGKSTFIRALKEGWLNPEIISRLPHDCSCWPVIDVNNILKNRLNIQNVISEIGTGNRAILHYDISYIHRLGLPSYEDDPADILFNLASHIDCVFIKADLAVLKRQHLIRERTRMRSKSRSKILWGTLVRRPLTTLRERSVGIHRRNAQVLYAQPQFLASCYGLWETYVCQLGPSRNTSPILTVQPATGPGSPPQFALCPPPHPSERTRAAPKETGAR